MLPMALLERYEVSLFEVSLIEVTLLDIELSDGFYQSPKLEHVSSKRGTSLYVFCEL